MSKSIHIPDDFATLPASAEEARALGTMYYFTGKPCVHGHVDVRRTANGECRTCIAVRSAKVGRVKWEAQRPQREALRVARAIERANRPLPDPEWVRQQKREAARRAYARKRSLGFREMTTEGYYAWAARRAREDYRRNGHGARRRRRERGKRGLAGNKLHDLRTPPWLTAAERAAIAKFYRDTPRGMVVDHIVPIVHPLLAGVHVIGNLQYLPRRLNIKKKNTLYCTEEDAARLIASGLAVWAGDINEVGEINWLPYRQFEQF